MLTLPNYQINKTVHQSHNATIYQATRLEDNTPVIIKHLHHHHQTERVSWFQHEYQLTNAINLPHVINVYDLLNVEDQWYLILEDFGGVALNKLELAGKISTAQFFTLALTVAQTLEAIHQQNIIHKNISPANILLNPDTNEIKIIDFGIATRLNRENSQFQPTTMLEGSLAYLAPEQTGRMNRAIDHRADFYALGATLYELLAGTPPFVANDPLTLIHLHIAQRPLPPHHHKDNIPHGLSAIILKLLAKNAEDRYQSATGLVADLQHAQAQFARLADVPIFPLGQQDHDDRFRLPQKLYQRDNEITTLLDAFVQASQGHNAVILVAGHPGIGKSALIQEIYKPITQHRGYFISGKFDQLQRNIPYLPLIQAFSDLVRQLLAATDIELDQWRRQLNNALGLNAQILIDVIPDLELIIGPQPSVPNLSPSANQNRFHLLFERFIQLFSRPEHPLVLFLDDLQWADHSSLTLLSSLVTSNPDQALFLVGAYRDNEMYSAHPLNLMLDTIRDHGTQIETISLGPLDLPHTTQLVADTVHTDTRTAAPLAELVWQKTGGNPFFVGTFLQSLYEQQLLAFDYQNGRWHWHLPTIQSQEITANVVDLLIHQIQKLPPATQDTLALAACLGNRFDLVTLALSHHQSTATTARHLQPALDAQFILPLDATYQLATLDNQEAYPVPYKFAHDRIQQAVYEQLDETSLAHHHAQIGRLLLSQTNNIDNHIFTITNHLNQGQVNLTELEKLQLAELNLKAGQKAKDSAAYQAANNYLNHGRNLLAPNSWHQDYELTRDLYITSLETTYLTNQTDKLDSLRQTILNHAQNLLDRVHVYEIQMRAHKAQNELLAVVNTGRRVLKLLDINLPDNPQLDDIIASQTEVEALLTQYPLDSLDKRPLMTNPHLLAAMRIMTRMFSASFVAAPNLIPILVNKKVALSIAHGTAPQSAFAYASYGLTLCGPLNDIPTGYKFGQLALHLNNQDYSNNRARPIEIVYAFITHWREPLRATLGPLLEGYQIALDTGDREYAAFCAFVYTYHLFAAGERLPKVDRAMADYTQAIQQLNHETIYHLITLYHQVVHNLAHPKEKPTALNGPHYDEATMFPRHMAANDIGTLCHFYFNKMYLAYLFHNFEAASDAAEQTAANLSAVTASVPVPIFYFYDSLIRLARWDQFTPEEQQTEKEQITANQAKLAAWAQHAPANQAHRHTLVQAEIARVNNDIPAAIATYDQAIDLAQNNLYNGEIALAYELTARFYQQLKQTRTASFYFQAASQAYQRWGALNKVVHLADYADVVTTPIADTNLNPSSTITTSTFQAGILNLDLNSIMKAAQAISGEIELDKLLTKLLGVLIENAGAERGVLLLSVADNDHTHIEIGASGQIKDGQVKAALHLTPFKPNLPPEQQTFSSSIVQYVIRTNQPVILDDAQHQGSFTQSNYVQHHQPKSVLCAPLLNRGQLVGIIYLENNLSQAAFTPNRIEILRLLATQAAISITNAQAIAARAEQAQLRLEQERLQMQNQLLAEQSEQLAKLNADKDKFFSIMAHDLRSPFNPILGMSKMLIMIADNATPEDVREFGGHIYDSAKHVYDLLENLLAWSRLERGLMEYHAEEISVAEIANRTVKLHRDNAASKGITLTADIPDELTAHADHHMLDAVIRNLVSNAIKFTPAEGSITINAAPYPQEPNRLVVAVADTGVGIPPDVIPTLFKPESQYTTPGTNNESGTGLGLTICQEMVIKNGGRIWLDSILGSGTTVYFTVPTSS
ncbi:MAG TPA: ATP-binding sensor histidine kinase [Anaerolineae bacterium]|nr:ATP-binding sensor histidine kinase [Anaerolineae bacterium]